MKAPPMTASIKEALERCRNYIASPLRMSNDDDEKKRRDDIVMCADQALASLERVGLATRAARYDALAKADAILATGLAPDEAAIRADERERCAEIADCMADEYDATSFTSTNADQVAALRSKEQAAHEIAAAIRSGGVK